MEFAGHGAAGNLHYVGWLRENHPETIMKFVPNLDADLEVTTEPGGDTGAVQVRNTNDINREWYHTDWVADRTIAWLDSLGQDDNWFCWMSFPDPHHPWDPPKSELHRVDWRDLDLPAGYIADADEREKVLATKPAHWMGWYDGSFVSNYEAPANWVPNTLTADQVREINAMVHIENELIDEGIGRIVNLLRAKGWYDDVDIVFTTDHGEFQGDFGLLFKGPYHVDGLLRLPLIWRPAPSANIAPAVVTEPVSLVSLAATFLDVAGVPQPEWAEAPRLPQSESEAKGSGRDSTITEWDSALFGVDVHVRTVVTSKWLYTRYAPGYAHDGTEGELYDLENDPLQRVNLFGDAGYQAIARDLQERIDAHEQRDIERAAHEIGHRQQPAFARRRPDFAHAVERGGERDHRPGRQAHAEIAAHRRRVPDLEGGDERVAARADERGGGALLEIGRASCRERV